MIFTVIGGKPYIVETGGIAYQCSISATEVKANMNHKIRISKEARLFNLATVRHFLGIKLIDYWDNKKNTVVKKSNKTVSSFTKEAPLFEEEPTVEEPTDEEEPTVEEPTDEEEPTVEEPTDKGE